LNNIISKQWTIDNCPLSKGGCLQHLRGKI